MDPTTATILLVEDDPRLAQSLRDAFELEHYDVVTASNGEQALEELERTKADVIVSDVMMPYMNGFDLCRLLRSRGDRRPILLLTARQLVTDRVVGLDAGADDYLPKPFVLDELLARVRALLRRVASDADVPSLQFEDLVLDVRSRTAERNGTTIELSKTEFDLLEYFMQNPRRVLTREMIFQRVWGYDLQLNSNSLEVFVANLRRKLEVNGGSRLIHTSRGVGYALRAP